MICVCETQNHIGLSSFVLEEIQVVKRAKHGLDSKRMETVGLLRGPYKGTNKELGVGPHFVQK
jgi:hypothetical protein